MSPENIGIITFQHHNFVKLRYREEHATTSINVEQVFFIGQERLLSGEEDKEQLA
jgi:hypothetical protein